MADSLKKPVRQHQKEVAKVVKLEVHEELLQTIIGLNQVESLNAIKEKATRMVARSKDTISGLIRELSQAASKLILAITYKPSSVSVVHFCTLPTGRCKIHLDDAVTVLGKTTRFST